MRKPSFAAEGHPEFYGVKKYLCGNTHAFDHISYAGLESCQSLDILFAASGDLRNIISTLNGCLEKNYPVHIAIIDLEPFVAARNLMLMLLLGSGHPKAAETAIHLWYSAFLTSDMVNVVKIACEKVEKMRAAVFRSSADDDAPISTKFDLHGGACVRVAYPRKVWKTVFSLLISEGRWSYEEAKKARLDVTMAPERVDYRDRNLALIESCFRPSIVQFWEDGMLLPFPVSRDGFAMPNFTLFDFNSGEWIQKDSYHPLHAWSIPDILLTDSTCPSALRAGSSDIHGALFLHLLHTFTTFIKHLEDFGTSTSFTLTSTNAAVLHLFIPSISSAPKLFDIIDVSNLIDATSGISSRSGYLDVSGVLPKIGVPLLKHDGVLISLFMNYIGNLDLYLGDEFTTEHIKDAGLKCVKYFGREFFRNHISGTGALEVANIGLVRTMDITSHFRDADDAWTAYMAWRRFEEIARETDMRMKKWHMKTRLNFDEGRDRMEVLKDWRMNCLGGISGNECYVLWEKK